MPHSPNLERRQEAQELRARGLTYQEIALQMGISRQRVQQITKPPREVYDIVRSRAKGKCEDCGVTLKNGHLHHLDSKKTDGYNDPSNLIYVCSVCHGVRHAKDEKKFSQESHGRIRRGLSKRWRRWQSKATAEKLTKRQKAYIEGLKAGKTKVHAALDAGYSESTAQNAAHAIEGHATMRDALKGLK